MYGYFVATDKKQVINNSSLRLRRAAFEARGEGGGGVGKWGGNYHAYI